MVRSKSAILFIFIKCCVLITAKSQVVNIESRRVDNNEAGFHGQGEIWFNYIKNLNTILIFGLRSSVQYVKDEHRFLIVTDASFAESNSNNIESTGYEHLRYNYMVNERFAWEAFGQVFFSRQMRLYPRYTMGAGPRYQLLRNDSMRINIGGSLMFEHESLQNPDEQYSSERLTVYLSWVLLRYYNLSFDWMWMVQPRLRDFNDFRVQSELRMDIRINARSRVRLTGSLLRDTRQPVGVPERFLNTRIGIIVDL